MRVGAPGSNICGDRLPPDPAGTRRRLDETRAARNPVLRRCPEAEEDGRRSAGA